MVQWKLKLMSSIMVNGKMDRDMAEENNFGLMDLFMRVLN